MDKPKYGRKSDKKWNSISKVYDVAQAFDTVWVDGLFLNYVKAVMLVTNSN